MSEKLLTAAEPVNVAGSGRLPGVEELEPVVSESVVPESVGSEPVELEPVESESVESESVGSEPVELEPVGLSELSGSTSSGSFLGSGAQFDLPCCFVGSLGSGFAGWESRTVGTLPVPLGGFPPLVVGSTGGPPLGGFPPLVVVGTGRPPLFVSGLTTGSTTVGVVDRRLGLFSPDFPSLTGVSVPLVVAGQGGQSVVSPEVGVGQSAPQGVVGAPVSSASGIAMATAPRMAAEVAMTEKRILN